MPRAGLLWLSRALGVGMFVLVGTVYAGDVGGGRWPAGHPWSGITLVILGGSFAFLPAPSPGPALVVKRVASGLALVSALLWAYSSRG
mgnify:CR=1 FL=1